MSLSRSVGAIDLPAAAAVFRIIVKHLPFRFLKLKVVNVSDAEAAINHSTHH